MTEQEKNLEAMIDRMHDRCGNLYDGRRRARLIALALACVLLLMFSGCPGPSKAPDAGAAPEADATLETPPTPLDAGEEPKGKPEDLGTDQK